ncbi:MAG: nucleoside 2-deoxyribosyltransferase [Candidatus Tectimicrobiota bacterium]
MSASSLPRLYLAGPEVFRPDAVLYAAQQRALCAQYGFHGLHPLDNGPAAGAYAVEALQALYAALALYRTDVGTRLRALPTEAMRCAMRIYLGNLRYLRQCEIIVANCNAFRGALVDDGTAYELGVGNALGKPTYGYMAAAVPERQKILQRYPCTLQPDGVPIDQDGYLVLDDFGTAVNLMLECGMLLGGGRLVQGTFEDCLRALRADLDSGALQLP